MFGTSKYNYQSFSRDHARKEFAKAEGSSGSKLGPKPGERAPSFEGITLDGQHFALKNLRGARNLVLTFGCATCPSTAASIQGLNDLYRDFTSGHFDSDTEFLFVYVREAHPGERTPAHASLDDKCRSAVLFRHQERLNLPILVDDLAGRIHRSYGGLPNSTFIIERSGRVAFRCSWTNPKKLRAALEELLQTQELFEVEKLLQGEELLQGFESQEAVPITVLGGEDLSLPGLRGLIHTNRALARGGRESVRNYRLQMGRAGYAEQLASRFAEPLALHPARAVAAAILAGAVIAAGLIFGRRLRRQTFSSLREPYIYVPRSRDVPGSREGGFFVVGI
jgi:peroxiredoxin